MFNQKTLGRYRIIALLGEGGMGEVYRAQDPNLQRDVALKILHPQFARQPNFRERFLQEARTAAHLDHPGIVKVYDSGEVNGTLFIVMEFIAGANLRVILVDMKKSHRQIVLPEVVQLLRQVCLALDYAHRHGVVHRDIKPDNIMLKPEPADDLPYHPILTDLGLAKLLDSLPITREGESMGTPAYMSPEQALGQPLDARSDVYSLGILLYELAVGKLPFPAKTLSEAIRYHTKEPPPPPHTLRADIPGALEQVILKALEKDPAKRYQKAVAMADALSDTLLPVTQVSAMPAAGGPVVSLLTQYQQSLVEERGTSLMNDFPEPAPLAGQDSIQVLSGDKTVRSYPIKSQGMTIGRGGDNDIVLDDRKASRRHARIEISGTDYRVVDLHSTNGTALGNIKLLPDVPEVWDFEKPLRIGDTLFRLERKGLAATIDKGPDDGTFADISLDGSTAGKGKIGLLFEDTRCSVAPGESAMLSLVIINQGSLVDHYRTRLSGVPAEWVTLPQDIRLMPGVHQEVKIVIAPPRSSKSKAGNYNLDLFVGSLDDPGVSSRASAVLDVGSFYQFTLDLRPKKQNGIMDGTYTVQACNQGNTPVSLALSASDAEDGCQYNFTPGQLSLAAGQEGPSRLIVKARHALAGDQARSYPFTLTAQVKESPGLQQQLQGEFYQSVSSFEMNLRPQKQIGVVYGEFVLVLLHQDAANLTIQLEAHDPEEGCVYTFTPSLAALQSGKECRIQVKVQPKTPLSSEMPKSYPFTITGRAREMPALVRQASGEWDQVAPNLEASLQPQKQSSEREGIFNLQLLNHSNSTLNLQLSGVDPEQKCVFLFSQPQFILGTGKEASIRLSVRPKEVRADPTSKIYPFTIHVRVLEAPALPNTLQGEWEKLPSKPLEPPENVLPPQKKSWFGGCMLILLGLVLTIAAGFMAGVMGSKSSYSTGWVCATPVWLAGLIFSIVIGRDFLKGKPIKTLVWLAVIGFLGILILFIVALATGMSF